MTASNRWVSELKRRRVFRVATVYAAAGFVVWQAADIAFPALRLPEWLVTAVVALTLLGFPIALVLAWAFDITAEGVRRTEPQAEEPASAEGAEPLPALLGRRTALVSGALVVLGIGLGAGWFLKPVAVAAPDLFAPAAPAIADKSIAVLPFADLSPGGDQEWFSDGLAEEILNALARLPDLRVASRTGSFQFRVHDGGVRAIADSLGVAHILEGSVRRAGERVRITAQLIRAADDTHLWSQSFDRDAADVIRVQEEIAFEIARTLQTALEPEELARMVAAGTNSIAAYEAFLRYWHLTNRSYETEDWSLQLQAIAALEDARAHDPRFFRAHNEAAFFWMGQLTPTNTSYGITTDLPYADRHARALERLHAAEAVAPDALSRLRVERQRARLELRLRDAFDLGQRIAELSPTGEEWFLLGIAAVMIGRYDQARDAFRRAAERPHELLRGRAVLAFDYHGLDAVAGAAIVDEMLAAGSVSLTDLYQSHRVLLAVGRIEQAARIAESYLARSTASDARLLVRVRQLCAEGRTAEAEAAAAAAEPAATEEPVIRWHLFSYLGRPADAAEVLRPYDEAGEIFALGTFLRYTFFDPRPFPKLSAVLRHNDALRAEPQPIPYMCRRAAGAGSNPRREPS
jgi:TolB-like protein